MTHSVGGSFGTGPGPLQGEGEQGESEYDVESGPIEVEDPAKTARKTATPSTSHPKSDPSVPVIFGGQPVDSPFGYGYKPDKSLWESPHAADWRKRVASGMGEVAGRDVRLDTGPQAEWRQRQGEIADLYAARVSGEAPSVAEQQFQRQQEANIRAAQAAAASTRGGMAGGTAQRILQDRMGQMNLEAAQQAAELRADEQARAEQLYAGLVQGARGQDITLAGEEAAMLLNQQQVKDNMMRYYMTMGYGVDEAEQKALRDYETLMMDETFRREAMKREYQTGMAGVGAQREGAWLNAISSGVGAVVDFFNPFD